MRKFLEDFILHLKSAGNFSRHTIRAYRSDILEFIECAEKMKVDRPRDIEGRFFLRNYMGFIQEKKISRNTLLRKISSAKSFVNYLISVGELKTDPFVLMHAPKKEKRLPQFMTEGEIEKLIEYNRPGNFENRKSYEFAFRDFAILVFMYSTGMRRSEVASMNVGDVDFISGFARVRGKGGAERITPVGDNALEILREYLEMRNVLSLGGQPLFVNRRGGRLSDAGIALVIKKMAKKARFARNITAHSIRHSFATHLLDRGCDLKSVQEMLGHKNLATTEIYTHVSLEKLRKVYDKAHPRSKKSR